MPKRKNEEEKIIYYKKKLKKLEEKKRRRHAVIYSSDSSVEENQDYYVETNNDQVDQGIGSYYLPLLPPTASPSPQPTTPRVPQPPSPPPPSPPLLPPPPSPPLLPPPSLPPAPVEEPAQPVPPELGPEYLLALGDPLEDIPKYGEDIQSDIAQRWQPILRKGLSKEARENILKAYLIPENCKLLRAPLLNPEISSVMSEAAKVRDKNAEQHQQQLGLGITAVSRAMTVLLGPTPDNIQSIKILSDACRILTDLHFTNSETRIKLLSCNLDKSFLSLKIDERDEYLFGSTLPDKIKAAKTIEKQGLLIKKTMTNKSSAPTSSVSRPRQGNWSGPPRSSWSRGGRGASSSRPSAAQGARRPPPPPPPPHQPPRAAYSRTTPRVHSRR